ncbi:MAG: glycosyltransferase [Flavobacteriales bacterium]|nr:glycosyltransferase [Flavobacteriales bacterium]
MSAERYNVLFLSSWYPSATHPTLGNFVARHAEAVATRHNVRVVYVTSSRTIDSTYRGERTLVDGIDTTIVYYKAHKLLSWWRRRNAFMQAMKLMHGESPWRIDVVHHNVLWPDVWQAVYLRRRFKIPFIVTEHWTGYDLDERTDPGWKVRRMSIYGTRHADLLCPVTENLAGAMRKFGLRGNYRVVPNVVDTSMFVIGDKGGEISRFLHVSSLFDPQKNISGLLRVWKKFSDARPHVHLTIGGDGPVEHFEHYASELGIDPATITFFPEKSPAEIAGLMSTRHALVMFSNYENLPCVIVEAMASGMAIISTRAGGIAEHVDTQRGFLVPKRDEDALLQVLHQFTQSRAQFDPQELRAYAKDHFSIDAIARNFSDCYRGVLQTQVNRPA